MRKSREEAAQTRRRIVEAASCEFRKNGIVATGLNDLMKAAGLTHGGFYKHFESKDQLVAEATTVALDALLEGMAAHPTINAAVAAYLSTRHRDNPASGCPLVAIGSELSRSDRKGARGGDGRLRETGGHHRGEGRHRRCPVPSSCRGRDDDRRGDDVAHGDRSGAVGGDPPGGREELDGSAIVKVDRSATIWRGAAKRGAVRTCQGPER